MKQIKIALTFGRFNLLHVGHMDLIQQMADTADTVCVGISTASNGKDFITWKAKRRIMAKAVEAAGLSKVVSIEPGSNPFQVFALAKDFDPSEVIVFLGEDQYQLAKSVERVYGWHTCCIPRLTSSTLVRSLIESGDWDLLSRLIPPSIFEDVINAHLGNNSPPGVPCILS